MFVAEVNIREIIHDVAAIHGAIHLIYITIIAHAAVINHPSSWLSRGCPIRVRVRLGLGLCSPGSAEDVHIHAR